MKRLSKFAILFLLAAPYTISARCQEMPDGFVVEYDKFLNLKSWEQKVLTRKSLRENAYKTADGKTYFGTSSFNMREEENDLLPEIEKSLKFSGSDYELYVGSDYKEKYGSVHNIRMTIAFTVLGTPYRPVRVSAFYVKIDEEKPVKFECWDVRAESDLPRNPYASADVMDVEGHMWVELLFGGRYSYVSYGALKAEKMNSTLILSELLATAQQSITYRVDLSDGTHLDFAEDPERVSAWKDVWPFYKRLQAPYIAKREQLDRENSDFNFDLGRASVRNVPVREIYRERKE